MPRARPWDERLWEKVEEAENGCWLWTACVNDEGYGQLNVGGRMCKAHRLTYELVVGKIPEGLQIDHLCRNTSCVNPAHLEAVTGRENTRRSNMPAAVLWRANRCKRGHPLSPDNTYVYFYQGRRKRRCRKCDDALHALARKRRRAAKRGARAAA